MGISKNLFRTLLLLAGIVAVYLGVNFFLGLYTYFDLYKKVPATYENWKIEEVRSGKYAISVSYHFQLEGVTYHDHFLFAKPLYPNQYLASDHLEKWREVKKTVWYSPKNPHHSSPVRAFPFKKGVHFVLSLGVIVYFLGLWVYLKRRG